MFKLKPKNLVKIQQNNQQYNYQEFKEIAITPQKGKQELFYNCPADVVFYGGAAGSGKTIGLLTDVARKNFLKNPLYNAVIFRRAYTEFTNPGGLVDESNRLYLDINGKLTQKPLDWKFPSGSKITFRHLQHEKTVYTYQGAQFNRLCFDELCHFSAESFFYLLSRNRSMSGIKPQVRATMNPDADSWVADFIKWWWDAETGYPIEERGGTIRYFIRINQQVHWADTANELIEKFDLKDKILNLIPDKLKESFEEEELISDDLFTPKSFTFIPATIFDNPKLIQVNPQYIVDLYNLHPVEQERLLKGNWKIKYEAGTVFDRDWFHVLDELPDCSIKWVRFWDMASTSKQDNPEACYTAGLKMGKFGDCFIIADLALAQIKGGQVTNAIKNYVMLDGNGVTCRWELEGGSAGKILEDSLKKEITEQNPLSDSGAVKPQGDKLTRALPFANTAFQGKVYLLRDATWNTRFLNAAQAFDGTKKDPPINDIIDSASGAYNWLCSNKELSLKKTQSVKMGDIRHRPRKQYF